MKPRIFHYYKSAKHFRDALARAHRTSDRSTQVILGKLEHRFRLFGVTAYLFPHERKRLEVASDPSTQVQLELEL